MKLDWITWFDHDIQHDINGEVTDDHGHQRTEYDVDATFSDSAKTITIHLSTGNKRVHMRRCKWQVAGLVARLSSKQPVTDPAIDALFGVPQAPRPVWRSRLKPIPYEPEIP